MHFGAKKLFLVGFAVLLLVGIPVSVYFLQKQQETRSHAEKSTNLTFNPESSASSPITKNIGDDVALDVMVEPGTNLVSFVKLEIQYDPEKIATASSNAFVPNSAIFPSVLEGPVYSSGKVAVTLSVGPDPTKAIQTKVKAATFTFKAIGGTAGTPTLVTYSTNTQALSIGTGDQASENVLASSIPATIIINGTEVPTETVTPSTEVTAEPPTPTDTGVPVPTDTGVPVPTDTGVPVPTDTGSPTPSIAITGTAPACTTLTIDKSGTGTIPLSLTFTATGTDADDTISKVTFNFGDGQVSDVTTGGGIGTNAINTQLAHTYSAEGTFQATAILTDSTGNVSDTTNCKQTVIAQNAGTTATATPTIAASGSTEVLFGIGAAALIFIIGGALLFFIL